MKKTKKDCEARGGYVMKRMMISMKIVEERRKMSFSQPVKVRITSSLFLFSSITFVGSMNGIRKADFSQG